MSEPTSLSVKCPRRFQVIVGFSALALTTAAGMVSARQSATEGVVVNPGARSIALGGAFAAIADDATAAYANPAGLVQILRPEISAELRATGSTSVAGSAYERDSGVSGIGFFSFVQPVRRWALALYSHQLVGLDFSFEGLDPVTQELSVRSYSAAVGYELSEDLSLGAGLSYVTGDRSPGALDPGISDADWGCNAGLLWSPADGWRLAAFYRQGSSFKARSAPLPLTPVVSAARPPGFEIPDTYGVGAAYRPGDGGLTFGLELDRVGAASSSTLLRSTTFSGGNQVHVGGEYAVLRWKPVVAFRAGVWYESLNISGDLAAPEVEPLAASVAMTHVAFGFGFAFNRFQLDLGVDVSDDSAVASLSMVVSF